MNEPLANMLGYNAWAYETLIAALSGLSEEQLAFRGAGVSGTVAELLLHIVGAQQTFVLRTTGRQHEGELNRRSPWPGFERLLELARETDAELVRIAESLEEDEDVVLPYQGQRPAFPKSFFLVHALEHGVEHRTELKIALMEPGIATPDLDGWSWAVAAGFGAETAG